MVAFSLAGMSAQRRAARAAQEANSIQRKQMQLEQAREKRETIRAARMARGMALNASAAQNVQTSSGAQGGMGSIGSQLNYNLSFLDQQSALADQASAALGRSRNYEARANTFSSLSNLTWRAVRFMG